MKMYLFQAELNRFTFIIVLQKKELFNLYQFIHVVYTCLWTIPYYNWFLKFINKNLRSRYIWMYYVVGNQYTKYWTIFEHRSWHHDIKIFSNTLRYIEPFVEPQFILYSEIIFRSLKCSIYTINLDTIDGQYNHLVLNHIYVIFKS